MASLSSIREGLATRLGTIAGLNPYARPGGTILVPAAVVVPGTIEFDETAGRGSDLLTFQVTLLVAESTVGLAQELLDPYLAGSGASSIKAAVEGDETLAGAADWTRVLRVSAYGDIEYSGKVYLGARFDVEVNADGS